MIYLDNAATTFPKPEPVQREAIRAIRFFGGNPGRSGHSLSEKTGKKVYEVREQMAKLVHCLPEEVAFTGSCTAALNMAIKGVMASGGHLLISDLEHNSVYRPVAKLKEKGLIDYDIVSVVPEDAEETLRRFAEKLRPDTKAIVCTHASNVTGAILPIAQLGALCHQMKLCLIVDFAQTAGIFPVDLKTMQVDIGCFAGHKSLYGLAGVGVLVVRQGLVVETLIEGGTGSESLQKEQPLFMPDRMESGTLPTVSILSLGGGLQYISHFGQRNLYDKEYQLCRMLYEGLQELPNIITYQGDFAYGAYVPLILFNVKGKDSTRVAAYLNGQGFAVRGGLHCAPLAHQKLGTLEQGAVRISLQGTNHVKQLQSLLQVLRIL